MANGNGNGHKIRVGWCPISECPACFPEDGNACRCGYRIDKVPCYHPVYRRRWLEAMELMEHDADQEAEPEPPHSLTSRVSKAQRTGQRSTQEAARARLVQMGLELEV